MSPSLTQGIWESLAGRLAMISMTPFLLGEIEPRHADALWMFGGYPDGGILGHRMYPDWQTSYLEALASRDLPAWGLERWAVEVKLTSEPGPDMVNRLQKTADMIGATRRVLICRIGRSIENDRTLIVSLPEWLDRLMHAPLEG